MEGSLAGDEDCSVSKCCRDFGYQCFAKNSSWASCLKNCTPATTKKVANGSWTCQALGEKNRCANQGENCISLGCCADVGTQCYAKNGNWGTCMKTCTKGTNDYWSCDPIGIRNTADYRSDQNKSGPNNSGFIQVEP